MKKVTLLIPLVLLALFAGCTDDSPVAPLAETAYTISFNDLPSEITAPAGVERTYNFTVTAASSEGVPRSGIALSVSASNPFVKVQAFSEVTGSSGTIPLEMTVTMPYENLAVVLTAETETETEITVLQLVSKPAPASLALTIATPEITVYPGWDKSVTLTVQVKDSSGRGVAGLLPEIIFTPMEGDNLGTLSDPVLTDSLGQSRFVYNTGGGYNDVLFRATLPEEEGGGEIDPQEQLLSVSTADDALYERISISAQPPYIYLGEEQIGRSQLLLRVVDLENIGLLDLPVQLSTDYGYVTTEVNTDESGLAEASFIFYPDSDWPEDNDDLRLEVTITASIPNTNYSAEKVIAIERGTSGPPTLRLSHQVSYIFADNGVTADTLTAILKDAENQAIADAEIIFTSTHGTCISLVKTDSFGIAKSVFKDNGVPSLNELGEIVPARIIAKYNPAHITAEVECEIRERNPVERLELRAEAVQMVAGSGDSTRICVTAYLANGDFAPNNTIVYWEVDNGRMEPPYAPIAGNFGKACFTYIAGGQKGVAHIQAWIDNGESRIYSNEVIITLKPGPADRIELRASPSELFAGDPRGLSTITATVLDEKGNAVDDGYLIEFETTLGTLERYATTTDIDGIAQTFLRPSRESGIAQVTAYYNEGQPSEISRSVYVTFKPRGPRILEVEAEDEVIPTDSYTFLNLTLRDEYANLMEEARTIYLVFIDEIAPPEGPSFANETQVDSIFMTGQGRLIVYGGTTPGSKILRIFTYRDEETRDDTVSVTVAPFMVRSGAPERIELSFDKDGYDLDGGVWGIDVEAMVSTPDGNRVGNNIPVVFSVDPEIASIEPGYTGNEHRNGTTTDGVAHSTLVYNSSNTFDELTLTATINYGGQEVIAQIEELVLPLQEGRLTLSADPDTFHFTDNQSECSVRLWTTLVDGHNVIINPSQVPLNWGSSRGSLEDGLPGSVYLQGEENDFFLDGVTPSINVNVTVAVEGYPNVYAGPQVIVITRNP